MTDAGRSSRRRLSSRALRGWAWIAGIATFASPAVALGLEPKPATAGPESGGPRRPVVVVRTITRRVIVREPARPSGVRYVYTGGGQTGGTTSGVAAGSGASGGGVPGSAPAATTGGS